MSFARLLVMGSANVDLVTRVSAMPKPGETLLGRSFKTMLGGKGANQAIAAARLGARTWFAGCVGRDAFGDRLRDALQEAHVDIGYLKRHPSEPTGTAIILVSDQGENLIVVTPSANAAPTVEDIEAMAPLFCAMDIAVMQLEIPEELVDCALDLAREAGVFTILDIGVARPVDDALLRRASLVSPNESEARAMTGIDIACVDDAARAAAQLRERGAAEVVLKLGALGAYYDGPAGKRHVPAFEIEPVDATAAGDAFTAALAVAWKKMPPAEALRFANGAGALAACEEGAQASMPEREALEAFLRGG